MGKLLAIPFIGWILAPIGSACYAIPFYFLWHVCNTKEYFYFLPEKFLNIGFWGMVCLFLTISIIKQVLFGGLFSASVENKSE